MPKTPAPQPRKPRSGAGTAAASAASPGHSPNTRRAYDSDWKRFVTWCNRHGHRELPAEPATVARYLNAYAKAVKPDGEPAYSAATVARWAAAIADRHRAADSPPPTDTRIVRSALAAIKRSRSASVAAPQSAAPLLTNDIATIVAAARKGAVGWASEVFERRDSALLLIGYAGALGRADLVGLTCGDITAHPRGGLLLPAAATSRAGDKQLSAAESHASCPPCAAVRWLQVAGAFDHGGRAAVIRLLKFGEPFDQHVCGESLPRTRARMPLFRSIRKNGNISATPLSGSSMHLAIRRRARLAGYDEDFVARLGVQSLRAGFITQAARNGADPHTIRRYTGHVSLATLQRYTERDRPADDAVPRLGL